jgi:hypothetical protein
MEYTVSTFVHREAITATTLDVYLEIGKKRTFAGAVEWPGWSRGGRDEASALQALFDYAPRYARVLKIGKIAFELPGSPSVFHVVERLEGDTTTDFGSPGIPPSADSRPVGDDELTRFQKLLKACWQALDDAAQEAEGKELRRGPRGGGRELEEILRHVRDAEEGYLSRLGWKVEKIDGEDDSKQTGRVRQAVLDALVAAAHGQTPERGPRGGTRWTARYFVRRDAWHVLDHAWEIEDRSQSIREK